MRQQPVESVEQPALFDDMPTRRIRVRHHSSGQARKADGQFRAATNSSLWMADMVCRMKPFLRGLKKQGQRTFVIEEFRALAIALKWPQPKGPQAWGALPRAAIKAHLIAPTEDFVCARAPKTHAHPVRLWEIL